MELNIAIAPDGTVAMTVDDTQGLAFEDASRRLRAFCAAIGAAGVPLVLDGDVERHTHDDTHQHARIHHH